MGSGNDITEKFNKIQESLARVPEEYVEIIRSDYMDRSMYELFDIFNTNVNQFFDLAHSIAEKYGVSHEFRFMGYKSLMENTIMKMGKRIPIDQFSTIILEFVNEVYNEDENFFLNYEIEEEKIENNEHISIFEINRIKELYGKIENEDKEMIMEKIKTLTIYAHAYFLLLSEQ